MSHSGIVDKQVNISLQATHSGLVDLQPSNFEISPTSGDLTNVKIFGVSPGHIEIYAEATPNNTIEYEKQIQNFFRLNYSFRIFFLILV